MDSASARRATAWLGRLARGMAHEPVVVILLLAGGVTVLAGSPVDGALLLVAGAALAWELARRRPVGTPPAAKPGTGAQPGAGLPPGHATDRDLAAGPQPGPAPGPRRMARQRLTMLALLAGIVVYATLVGLFTRYSWPATVAVAGLAAAAITAAWQGPLRPRRDPGKLPRLGATLWGGLLVAAGSWELAAFAQQPTLTAASYDHPTISTLADPLLGSAAGRAAGLAVWLLIGWFLVER